MEVTQVSIPGMISPGWQKSADRVISVATEGVEVGMWNGLLRVGSAYRFYSVWGIYTPVVSACAVVIIKFCEHDNFSELRARSC